MGLPDKALGDEGLDAVLQGEERQVERHLAPARRRCCRCRGRRSGRGAHPASGALARFPIQAIKMRPAPAVPVSGTFPFLDRAGEHALLAKKIPCF